MEATARAGLGAGGHARSLPPTANVVRTVALAVAVVAHTVVDPDAAGASSDPRVPGGGLSIATLEALLLAALGTVGAGTPRVFAARLCDQVSLDAIDEELRAVVVGPTEPAHVSLWVPFPETSR